MAIRNRILTGVLSVAMLLAYIPALPAYAADRNAVPESVVTDDARFAGAVYGNEDKSYRYSDRWFTGSSYVLNRQLAALSSYAVCKKYSITNNGIESEGNEATGLLTECGYKDVEANQYYNGSSEPDSMGCVIGTKKILDAGKKYTLLAVFPDSPKYGQEWAGNFTVGKNSIHQGFKAGRDEVLRFLKNYISKHKIKGALKFWLTGHSRFATVSNLTAGFLAGGGECYLGKVSISPEDVYCYTFAAPSAIKDSAKKKDALSVAGSRAKDDNRYLRDSAGEPYSYEGNDANELVNPAGKEYQGIHNCMADHDIVPKLPPEKWGLGRYGTELPLTDGSAQNKARMLEMMEKYYPSSYKNYIKSGDEDTYRWMTFDFSTLGFVDDTECKEYITQALMFSQMIDDGLSNRANTADQYVDGGYEQALSSAVALVGLCPNEIMDGASKNMEVVLKAVLFSYLAYAAERLNADRGLDEKHAVAVAAEELIEYIIGKKIDPETYNVDDFIEQFSKYIVDSADYVVVNDDDQLPDGAPQDAGNYDEVGKVKELKFSSKTAEKMFNTISNVIMTSIPPEFKNYLKYLVEGYNPNEPIDSDNNKAAIGKFVFAFLNGCAYGSGNKENPGAEGEAHAFRGNLYAMIQGFMGESDFKPIIEAMGTEEYGTVDGSNNAAEFLDVLIKYLAVEKDADGSITKQYDDLEEAADAFLSEAVEKIAADVLATNSYKEGTTYHEAIETLSDTLKNHVKQAREAGMDLLFLRKDNTGKIKPFSTADNIRQISTLSGQANNIVYAHLPQTYDSWMKAQVTLDVYREEAVSVLRLLGKECADKVPDQDKLDIMILQSIDKVRDAKDADEIEGIIAEAKTKTIDFIKAKEKADIEKAKEEREKARKERADQKAADAVSAMIDALPAADSISVDDKDAIEAARTAYDFLTPSQQAKVTAGMLGKLKEVEKTLDAAIRAKEFEIWFEEALKKAEEEKNKEPVSITALILKQDSFVYDGKAHKPEAMLVIAGDRIAGSDDFAVSYSDVNSKDAGTYKVTVSGKGRFTGSASAEYTISKAGNPVTVKGKTVKVKYKKVSKKAQKIKRAKAISVKGAKGKVTYALASVKNAAFKKYFSVNTNKGVISVKKGLKKGTYRLKIRVKAAGDKNYNAKSQTAAVKITVK